MARKKAKNSYQASYEKIALKRRLKNYARRFYKISFIVVVVVLVSVGVWLWHFDAPKTYMASLQDSFFKLTAKTGLRLEHVSFEGNKYTGQEELAEQLGVGYGLPILSLDLESLRQEIKKQPWVKDAQVQRILPSNIKVVIVERKPIAVWELGKKYYLIDSDGVNLTEIDSPDVLPFPLVIGAGANKEATRMFAVLSHEKKLYEQVASASLMGGRRWNVELNNGIEVMLPADNMSDAWSELARMDENERILSRQIKSVDMRLKDRIYIRPIEGEVVKGVLRNKSAFNGSQFMVRSSQLVYNTANRELRTANESGVRYGTA